MDNKRIDKTREYFTAKGKAPFIFNIFTGEINTDIKNHSYFDGKYTLLQEGWRFITDEYYPVYDKDENFIDWKPYGYEDREFKKNMERIF